MSDVTDDSFPVCGLHHYYRPVGPLPLRGQGVGGSCGGRQGQGEAGLHEAADVLGPGGFSYLSNPKMNQF